MKIHLNLSIPADLAAELEAKAIETGESINQTAARALLRGMGMDPAAAPQGRKRKHENKPLPRTLALLAPWPKDLEDLFASPYRRFSDYMAMQGPGAKWATGVEITLEEKATIQAMQGHYSL